MTDLSSAQTPSSLSESPHPAHAPHAPEVTPRPGQPLVDGRGRAAARQHLLERVQQLHAEGLRDAIIAQRLGCGTSTVKRARTELGLVALPRGDSPSHRRRRRAARPAPRPADEPSPFDDL